MTALSHLRRFGTVITTSFAQNPGGAVLCVAPAAGDRRLLAIAELLGSATRWQWTTLEGATWLQAAIADWDPAARAFRIAILRGGARKVSTFYRLGVRPGIAKRGVAWSIRNSVSRLDSSVLWITDVAVRSGIR